MNNYYIVDYENTGTQGLNGVGKLSEDDVVCIIYSEKADRLTFGLARRLRESKAVITYKKVEVGPKNALDFQLASFLGYIICENQENPYRYYIVAEDKGYESVGAFWKGRAEIEFVSSIAKESIPQPVSLVSSVQPAKTDLEQKVLNLIKNKEEAKTVAKIITEKKTKLAVNNALMKQLPSKGNKESAKIYKAIKPLIADKPGR